MKINGIYSITSKIKSKRCYIGSAIDITMRWKLHLNDLRKNEHHSIKLQRHYNKYGESDLVFSILLGCEKEQLIANEQFFIDSYNPYFNICKVAGSVLGCHWNLSKIVRDKMSKSQMGHIVTKEMRIKMSIGHKNNGKGVIHLQYIKDNIGIKPQWKIAEELGINQSTISKILKRCA